MKADILRRAEEISDDSDEEDDAGVRETGGGAKGKGRAAALDDDELEDADVVKVRDGDASDDEEDEDDDEAEDAVEAPRTPETILELVYIRDAKLFDRDGQTRRSKARADLKAQTGASTLYRLRLYGLTRAIGMSDEQIEGWRIMLERDVRIFPCPFSGLLLRACAHLCCL